MTQNMETESILWMGTDEMIPRYAYNKSLAVRFPDRYKKRANLIYRWLENK
jgi:hypothetical protein